jgi:alanine racemase
LGPVLLVLFFAVIFMPRPILAVIHPQAVHHNLGVLREKALGAKVWAVIKANAYGHGIERIFPVLSAADGLALLDLDEAKRVRDLGWRGPVLLLEGVFEPRDLELCSALDLWHVVHQQRQLDWLAAHKTQQPHHVFLKVNTGMNRLGFGPVQARGAYARLMAMPQVAEVSWMTHFSDADAPKGIAHQLQAWQQAVDGVECEYSLSNSASILRHAATPTNPLKPDQVVAADWVRAGIAMYGAAPDYPLNDAHGWGLQPAMSLRSRLIALQTLQAGDTVGYGSTFQASQAMTIGVVACGYADGYPRHAVGHGINRTPVMVDGVECPLVGRVSMDMLCIDLQPLMTQRPEWNPWEAEVVLWGLGRKGESLPAERVAYSAQTIAYELYCALAPRVPVVIDHTP